MKLFAQKTHKSSRRAQDSLRHRVANDPYLDWSIMIVVTVVLSVIAIGMGFFVYKNTQGLLSAPVASDSNSSQKLFDTDALSRTLKDFNMRAEEQKLLTTGYVGVADPSL